MRRVARYYARERRIAWQWQSIDSKSVPAPLGGEETGRNPTDRGKSGSKIHLLIDEVRHWLYLSAVPTNMTSGLSVT